jgi:exodeoxyribonuclease VIII
MRIDYDWRNIAVDGAGVELALRTGEFRGVIANLPNKVYHAISNYYSSTSLKYLFGHSPMHYRAKYIDKILPSARSAAMLLGSVVHSLVLTPDEYDSEFYVMPDVDGRTKEGKERKAQALLDCGGRDLISEYDHVTAAQICESVRSHTLSDRLLGGATVELSYFWQCPLTGLLMRSKIDGINGGDLIELKTTTDVSPSGFSRQAYNMHYDLSMAHYMEGIRVLTDERVKGYFIAVETEAPYVVQTYEASEDFIDGGHAKWLSAIQALERSLSSGVWPGYQDERIDEGHLMLMPPAWTVKKEISEDGI